MFCFERGRFAFKAAKTKVLASEVRAPQQLTTSRGLVVDVLPRNDAHKWLGCMLSAQPSDSLDVDFHIQAAGKAFYAKVRVFRDEKVSLQHSCSISMLW